MIAGIVQARMGSARSPGKVLRVAAGMTLLEHLVSRLQHACSLDMVVVATSDLPADEPIEDLCREIDVRCVRGSETDVLDRYFLAAKQVGADQIVRITADCPLIDPAIVDLVVGVHAASPDAWDLVTNRHPLTFPDGMDVDVMRIDALEHAWVHAKSDPQREHVIPYFWEAGHRVRNVEHSENLFPTHRWTVDYEEDVQLVTRVIEALYTPGGVFGMADILAFVDSHPDVAALNAHHLPAPHRTP